MSFRVCANNAHFGKGKDMPMEKVYSVSVDYYNYFAGGSKTETKRFSRIIDAFVFQKESAAHDFDYDDAYQTTSEIRSYWNTSVKKTNVHPYKDIKMSFEVDHNGYVKDLFSPEEIEYLLHGLDDAWESEEVMP